MAPRTRSTFHKFGGKAVIQNWDGSGQTLDTYFGVHTCTDETHPGPPYRTGGPLSVKKDYFLHGLTRRWDATLGTGIYYHGRMWSKPYIPAVPTATNLSGWGAIGWNRTYPLHPIYNLGVSIGEMKDLGGMVNQTIRGFNSIRRFSSAYAKSFSSVGAFLRSAKTTSRNIGDSYLYGAFGLWPMLQDLIFLLQEQEKLNKKLRWLQRHNGKTIRRKIELDKGGFSESIPRFITPAASLLPSLHTSFYGPKAFVGVNMPLTKTYDRRIWFVAKYRIWIPELVGWSPAKPPPGGLQLDLLGLAPDPAIIWKLFPWSWLLDWFTSVGAMISNIYLRAHSQVVAEYAYVMASENYTWRALSYCDVREGDLAVIYRLTNLLCESSTRYVLRNRVVANPYGFGITFKSLSAYQWSILAALGLSRGGKHSNPRS